MSYNVIKLDEEPIVIVRVYGEVTLDEQANLMTETAKLIENDPGKIYRVLDATGRKTTFAEMLRLVSRAMKGWMGTASDPRIVTLAVLENSNSFLAIRVFRQTLGGRGRFLIFNTVAEALAAAREMIATEAAPAIGMTPPA